MDVWQPDLSGSEGRVAEGTPGLEFEVRVADYQRSVISKGVVSVAV